LAKAWPQILKVYPNARLNVIGSGKLYDRNARLGKYEIADANYEKEFMPYLVDQNGIILPSVKFWGILGNEKNEILQKTRVGVPNPWGKTETFGYTAIEMQIHGAKVTTVKCSAYIETISPKSGILYDNQKNLDKVLATSVVSLLGENEHQYRNVIDFLDDNFAVDKVAAAWNQLFLDIVDGKKQKVAPLNANKSYRLKKWKELNRKLKNTVPFGYKFIPSLWHLDDVLWKLGVLLKRDHIVKHVWHKYILNDNPLY
jgi:glycosyltransferase involved in cell wall biosynthesis